MAEGDIAIKIDHVSKTFKLPHEKQSSIKSALINRFHGGKRTYERQQVLDAISFEIKQGDFFGIVGRNGSGKSTLLKLLAGIYTPTKGNIQVNGKLTPFIELGVGFNPELSGRENVFLNGALLGFNRQEITAMYDDIVEFAELERFMDQKLKNYSSGMQVRLAFSIAIRARSDILLLDEVLAVGDAAFQQKCFDYFEQLKREHKTVVFVTHDMEAVKRFCTNCVYLKAGKILKIGTPGEISQIYIKENFAETLKDRQKDEQGQTRMPVSIELELQQDPTLKRGEPLNIQATITSDVTRDVIISATILKDEIYVGGFNTKNHKDGVRLDPGKNKFAIQFDTSSLGPTQYSIGCGVFQRQGFKPLGILEERPKINVTIDEIHKDGLANVEGRISHIGRN